ncbi:hypothetical protein [Bradyrhizobium acaciae]|uniref:hypothetical protein n=1 Tax=Bradyrhizobium acaciae TaxID=2683706 RepID=UPI001E4CC0F0|nr:hypothetical protein [Bradyrhizobium acaciae]MCC8982756.1 hypothetical protein [Bradyrhizobium acaciae]
MLLDAVAHDRAGRATEAGTLCGDILTAHPDHVPALHLSAVIAFVTDRADTPWYPTMRLFCQDKPQAWERVLERMSDELARVAASERELLLPARLAR